MRFSSFTLFFFILISVYAPLCIGEVLFEDDFEKGDIDKSKWAPTAGWDLDGGTLEVNGGEVGMSVKDDFTDFEFYVDFHLINGLEVSQRFIFGRKIRPLALDQTSKINRKKHLTFFIDCGLISLSGWQTYRALPPPSQ